jgi:hypothetical protein
LLVLPQGNEWFVAPDGTPQGDGTREKPWDLQTALSHPAKVKPGDTIWLRGGTYGTGGATIFTSRLAGTKDKPIIVRGLPGERATINGGISAYGSWTWFWGFEITNSSTVRETTGENRPYGINMLGRGLRAINMVIHDVGHPGIGFWSPVGDGGEIYGCVFWGIGIYDTSPSWNGEPRGSPIYAQNQDGGRYIMDNISFRSFTTGFKVYTEKGYADGFHVEGNVVFDSPEWTAFFTGGSNPMKHLVLANNFAYRRKTDSRRSVRLGYSTQQVDCVVTGNYFVGGSTSEAALFVNKFRSARVIGNTLVGITALASFTSVDNGTYIWDRNTYFGTNQKAFRYNGSAMSFEEWIKSTGFDTQSTFSPQLPQKNAVFVRKNQYEPGRANIIVYNWELRDEVNIDLSGILKPGQKYRVLDAQNYFGLPVRSGQYDGKPVTLPMNLTEVTPLVGEVKHIQNIHTAPEFAVFIVIPD